MPAREDMAHGAVCRTAAGGEQGAEDAAPVVALPAHDQGPEEKDMSRAVLRAHRDGPCPRALSLCLDASGDGGGQGPEEAAPCSALPAHDQDPAEGSMAHAVLRAHRDAGHGGDEEGARTGEEGARAGQARSSGVGGPTAGPIHITANDALGSDGGAVGPRRAPRAGGGRT